MRKSAAVKLTLVPMLAASALAHAQAPGETPPATQAPEVGRPLPFEWSDGAPEGINWTLAPPGLTPTREVPPCDEDPYAFAREDCNEIHTGHGGGLHGVMVVRGGFGGHFSGGGHGG